MTRRTLVSWNPAPGGGYRYANHFVGILSPMDCRGFRSKHVAFVDDFLSGEEVVAMQRHLLECEQCAAHDAKIRRALLLFRNLPAVEPSSDFYSRLSARIESERAMALAHPTVRRTRPRDRNVHEHCRGPRDDRLRHRGVAQLDAAKRRCRSLAGRCDGTCDAVCRRSRVRRSSPRCPPGMPVWPMVYFAEQAPMRFAQVQFTQTSLRR